MSRLYWTAEEDARLLQFRSDGVAYVVIAEALDRDERACVKRMSRLNERARLAAAGERVTENPKLFTESEVADLLRMRDIEGVQFKDIDVALGRRPGVCNSKYRQLKAMGHTSAPRRDDVQSIIVPPDRIADRDLRSTLYHPTITAALCGDPLPGNSALDKRVHRCASTEVADASN